MKLHPNKIPNGKPVICVETGVIYASLGEAAEKTGIDRSHLSAVCNGRRKTTGGYHWRFVKPDYE